MAVIEILDMDMPNNCKECENRNCRYYNRVWWNIDDETMDYSTARNPKCPLKSFDEMIAEIEYHRNKTAPIDKYDLVGDCLDIIRRYCEGE